MDSSQSNATCVSLLDRIQQVDCDDSAWQEFVDRYGKRIFTWCENRGLRADDAEDITQQVLIRMTKYVRTFVYDTQFSFSAYLRRVTENAILDFLKQNRRRECAEGGATRLTWMQTVEAREELVTRLQEAFDLELLDRAMSHVQTRVNERRWAAWFETTIAQRDSQIVASELSISVATLYAAKNQVGKLVRDEILRLEQQSRPSAV